VVGETPEGFAAMGNPASPGPKVYSMSGHVARPGNYEFPMGTTLATLLDAAGGILHGHGFKAALTGGAASGFITADHLDVPLEFDAVKAIGGEFGTGAVMVFDDATCMVSATQSLLRFFRDESCGKCTPCRDGTFMMHAWLADLEEGRGDRKQIEHLEHLSGSITGTTCCALADGACLPVRTALTYFRDEFLYHAIHGACPPGVHHIRLPYDTAPGTFHADQTGNLPLIVPTS